MIQFLKYTEFITEATINAVIDKLGVIDDSAKINTMDDYINHFIDKGAKPLAAGSSAEVLEFKGGVIKIFGAAEDPAMTRFLSFCSSNKSNPFIPKIEKILKSYADEEERWIFAIFMEDLRPSPKDFENKLNTILFDDKLVFGKSTKDDNEFFSKVKKTILEFSEGGMEKPLDDVLSFLRKGISKFKYGVDFGPQNWMMRGSQLVLIDPFWPTLEK